MRQDGKGHKTPDHRPIARFDVVACNSKVRKTQRNFEACNASHIEWTSSKVDYRILIEVDDRAYG